MSDFTIMTAMQCSACIGTEMIANGANRETPHLVNICDTETVERSARAEQPN
jgi:hypothetical protein